MTYEMTVTAMKGKFIGHSDNRFCRSLTMIVKLLSENTDTYQAIQSLVSLVCESTSEKGQVAIRDKVCVIIVCIFNGIFVQKQTLSINSLTKLG